jgi:hypothetical protein
MQATFLASRISIEGQLRSYDVLLPLLLKHYFESHCRTKIIIDGLFPVHISSQPCHIRTPLDDSFIFKGKFLGPLLLRKSVSPR